jgi:heme/copper-type cytochrome/quinol oxidase subunit 2
MKKIILCIVVLMYLSGIVSAANNSDPFSPGNAKTAYDKQDQSFKDIFIMLFGIFWLVVGAVVMVSFGGATATFAAHKSGQFADPEKKSGSGASMLGIIFIVLGLLLCLSVVKPIFGF